MKVITNTQNVKNFSDVDFQDANVVVVTNAKYRDIAFLKVEDGEDEEEAVKSYLSELTFGCNYRYEIVKKIGSTYFCNYPFKLTSMKRLEEEIIKTGFRYIVNEDGTFDVCYDHSQDSYFSAINKHHVAKVREDDNTWYIEGEYDSCEGEYPKKDWMFADALRNQCIDD